MTPEQRKTAIEVISYYVHRTQLHTRRGSRAGQIPQEPLSDAAQSLIWIKGRDLLRELGEPVPVSGTLDDG